MHILKLSLEHFRNIDLAHIGLKDSWNYFVGPNGQGKTNFLEAAGFITALRSFRNQQTSTLIQYDKKESQLFFTIQHERLGECTVHIIINSKSKRIFINSEPITHLSSFLGLFPTIVLSAEDMQWLRGSPGLRRKFLDLTLASMDSHYLGLIKHYQQCLDERNALLKQPGEINHSLLDAFESAMIQSIGPIVQARTTLVDFLNTKLQKYYNHISNQSEDPKIIYQPNIQGDALQLDQVFKKSRYRDKLVKSTTYGPHRDDFTFELQSQYARQYASEGQQRSLVISLRLAQMAYFEECSKIAPVVLADDVLGQLDTHRRERFWSILENKYQLIVTGTSSDPVHSHPNWQCWNVDSGKFKKINVLA